MRALIIGVIIIIIILSCAEYALESAMSQSTIITITEKSIRNNIYYVNTLSLKEYSLERNLYYELDLQGTYKVKIMNNKIEKIISRVN